MTTRAFGHRDPVDAREGRADRFDAHVVEELDLVQGPSPRALVYGQDRRLIDFMPRGFTSRAKSAEPTGSGGREPA